MNILRNMEAAFVATAAIACTSAYLLSATPDAQAVSTPMFDAGTPMQVVVITGKRMSADEKLQSMREERQMAIARNSAVRRG